MLCVFKEVSKTSETLLTIHLFIFNAGPMLIAVFITEMVILHKYVYLLLLLLLLNFNYSCHMKLMNFTHLPAAVGVMEDDCSSSCICSFH